MTSRLLAWALTAILVVSLLPSMATPIVSAQDGDHLIYLPLLLKTPFPSITLMNDQAYRDIFGWNVFGEIMNDSYIYIKNPVLELKIIKNNLVIESREVKPLLTNFPPGAEICFGTPISVWAEDMSYEIKLISYELDISTIAQPLVENPWLLVVDDYTPGVDIPAYIIGDATNTSDQIISDVWITGAFFDANGKVTGCEWDYMISTIDPNSTIPFLIPFYGRLAEDAVNFRLYTDGTVNE